jgi:hypothetical protein
MGHLSTPENSVNSDITSSAALDQAVANGDKPTRPVQ